MFIMAVIIFFVNRHYQKKGVPLEYAHDEESISHRIASANDGVDDSYFKETPD
jgi:hypothetical protein